MCVVATYVIMHVIVYFVCANVMVVVATYVSGCLIWLCKHVLISEPYAVYRTHLDLANRLFCVA